LLSAKDVITKLRRIETGSAARQHRFSLNVDRQQPAKHLQARSRSWRLLGPREGKRHASNAPAAW
jgi:hypothetical protein